MQTRRNVMLGFTCQNAQQSRLDLIFRPILECHLIQLAGKIEKNKKNMLISLDDYEKRFDVIKDVTKYNGWNIGEIDTDIFVNQFHKVVEALYMCYKIETASQLEQYSLNLAEILEFLGCNSNLVETVKNIPYSYPPPPSVPSTQDKGTQTPDSFEICVSNETPSWKSVVQYLDSIIANGIPRQALLATIYKHGFFPSGEQLAKTTVSDINSGKWMGRRLSSKFLEEVKPLLPSHGFLFTTTDGKPYSKVYYVSVGITEARYSVTQMRKSYQKLSK